MNTLHRAETAQLVSTDGQTATLRSVHIEGRLDGLLLGMKAHQHYRNTGKTNLETVYTCPLPWGATLLGLNAEIGGHRLHGTVLEKKQATERYEKAIDEGDTPIMVERSARGLYTANLGNLKPGEDAVIEIEYAQLLRFEQGQIRITIPTTVAPRFGDAHTTGGLVAHESVDASLLVDYALTVHITLTGEVARATVQCPSHAVSLASEAAALTVTLQQGAFLDRDFVLLLQGLQGQSFATVVPDGDEFAVLASFYPDLIEKAREPLLLKVLVDCSGSMAGDSIVAARAALHEVLKELDDQDWISYSRFGNAVQHDLPALCVCDAATIETVASLIAKTEADLGGTQMNAALLSTFKHGSGRDGKKRLTRSELRERSTDVLLITDGDIWDVEEVIRAAQTSGHRVFAIGVGSAPAESLLREVAEKTGGACELLSPNQDVGAVIVRMARRLRAPRSGAPKMDWGQEVSWQSPLPASLFGGDTLHLYSRLKNRPQRVPMLSWSVGQTLCQAGANALEAGQGDTIQRMAGAAQFDSIGRPDPKVGEPVPQRLELALRYQLVTDLTNLILVHVRQQGDKASGLPVLEQVAHMQAAGWGGAGSVRDNQVLYSRCLSSSDLSAASPAPAYVGMATPAVWRTVDRPSLAAANIDALAAGAMDDFEVPVFLRKREDGVGSTPVASPGELLDGLNQVALTTTDFDEALQHLLSRPVGKDIIKLLEVVTKQAGGRATAWALLLDWLAIQLSDRCTVNRHAQRLLRSHLGGVDERIKLWAAKRFAAALPGVNSKAWGTVLATLIDKVANAVRGVA
jgi:Ca-activated chloride channel family protein